MHRIIAPLVFLLGLLLVSYFANSTLDKGEKKMRPAEEARYIIIDETSDNPDNSYNPGNSDELGNAQNMEKKTKTNPQKYHKATGRVGTRKISTHAGDEEAEGIGQVAPALLFSDTKEVYPATEKSDVQVIDTGKRSSFDEVRDAFLAQSLLDEELLDDQAAGRSLLQEAVADMESELFKSSDLEKTQDGGGVHLLMETGDRLEPAEYSGLSGGSELAEELAKKKLADDPTETKRSKNLVDSVSDATKAEELVDEGLTPKNTEDLADELEPESKKAFDARDELNKSEVLDIDGLKDIPAELESSTNIDGLKDIPAESESSTNIDEHGDNPAKLDNSNLGDGLKDNSAYGDKSNFGTEKPPLLEGEGEAMEDNSSQNSAYNSQLAERVNWLEVKPGLSYAFLPEVTGESFVIISISPDNFSFSLHMASEEGEAMSLKTWAHQHGLVAAINASMYLPDRITSTGHMKSATHVNNEHIGSRLGAFFLAEPKNKNLPLVDILEVGERAWEERFDQYHVRVQNFRLLGRDGTVHWKKDGPRHSVAAIGKSQTGKVFFMLGTKAMTVPEFATRLISYIKDISSVIYVEGSDKASLYLKASDTDEYLWQGKKSLFNIPADPHLPLPNIIGVQERRD